MKKIKGFNFSSGLKSQISNMVKAQQECDHYIPLKEVDEDVKKMFKFCPKCGGLVKQGDSK